MSIKIANDAANGTVILKGQNVAGDRTITMPNLDCELAPRMQLMTAQNSTSGTSIYFTGIPSWAKKITVMFNRVSTSGTSALLVQVGSGSVQDTGYTGSTWTANTNNANYTTGFLVNTSSTASYSYSGICDIFSLGVGNAFVFRTTSGVIVGTAVNTGSGSVTLSSTLDRIRVTTVNGTDTFDAGQIGVLYEG